MSKNPPLITAKSSGINWRDLSTKFGTDTVGLALALIVVIALFSFLSPRFLTLATFDSVAFQLPELGLLTLAMLMPIISGGINLSITFTANICGLTVAWFLKTHGGPDASMISFCLGTVLAVGVGVASGLVMGQVIALTGAHPILVTLSMMIFLRGLGEFLTRGGDISAFLNLFSLWVMAAFWVFWCHCSSFLWLLQSGKY